MRTQNSWEGQKAATRQGPAPQVWLTVRVSKMFPLRDNGYQSAIIIIKKKTANTKAHILNGWLTGIPENTLCKWRRQGWGTEQTRQERSMVLMQRLKWRPTILDACMSDNTASEMKWWPTEPKRERDGSSATENHWPQQPRVPRASRGTNCKPHTQWTRPLTWPAPASYAHYTQANTWSRCKLHLSRPLYPAQTGPSEVCTNDLCKLDPSILLHTVKFS